MDIKFNIRAWSGPNQEYISDPVEYVINVKNSVLLYGTYNEDLNLTNNQEYLVSGNVIMYGNAVLTIQPGTIIKVSDDVRITFLENFHCFVESNDS